jgi:serine/threonine protein phosphatase PrpC/pSer/pThr/pTyr-binding forkhead associated (FHA) protein
MQQANLGTMSPERFEESYLAHLSASRPNTGGASSNGSMNGTNSLTASSSVEMQQQLVPPTVAYIDSIVLKFTTLSENCSETPSFFVSNRGAKIGQDASNDISIPTDNRLAIRNHCLIEFTDGAFYMLDNGYDFSASLRIGVGAQQLPWILFENSRFSAGNSIFRSGGEDADGNLVVEIMEGPLKGTTKIVTRESGATIGRSSDNFVSVPDRELSRKHSRIHFDAASNHYLVSDMGSTNGTYMQLVGPYAGRYRLSLNDHILVGRTGFSINRFDYGLSEEIGHRQSMEDACAIVQHLNIVPLNASRETAPQSYFAVYDGHGGDNASIYLSEHLHVNLSNNLAAKSTQLFECLENKDEANADQLNASGIGVDGPSFLGIVVHTEDQHLDRFDRIVIKCVTEAFSKTDSDFLGSSQNANHGSTATTVLILGDRVYCNNVGDSRSVICRNFAPIALSVDHKPSRPDEAQRIRDAGGFVINNRVMGELAVSRAFGDCEFKKGIQVCSIDVGNAINLPSLYLALSFNLQSMIGGDGEDELADGDAGDQPLVISVPEIQV